MGAVAAKVTSGSTLAVWLCAAVAGCHGRPPHAVVTIEDPQGVAQGATLMRVGHDPAPLDDVRLASKAFPLTITLTTSEAGDWPVLAEAVDAEGNIVGRGRVVVRLDGQRPGRGTLTLGAPCALDGDCEPALFCLGTSQCAAGVCSPLAPRCPVSPFACVSYSCSEAVRACDTRVSHEACAPLDEDGAPMATYCDPAAGCVRGQPCYDDATCNDASACNGREQCISGRCLAGAPPAVVDDNPCNLDV